MSMTYDLAVIAHVKLLLLLSIYTSLGQFMDQCPLVSLFPQSRLEGIVNSHGTPNDGFTQFAVNQVIRAHLCNRWLKVFIPSSG